MIDDVEVYFARGCGRCERFATADCATRRWSDGLHALRQVCRDAGLAETAKWGHPCYLYAGRNIAILGALRDSFRLGFFDAALLKDPAGVLQRQGPNSRHADTLRFTDASQVAERAAVVRAYLHEAMGYAEAGIRPSREPQPVELPDALVEAMDADPALADAFHRLTPGRQRSYVIQLASAKTEATARGRASCASAPVSWPARARSNADPWHSNLAYAGQDAAGGEGDRSGIDTPAAPALLRESAGPCSRLR